MLLTRYEDFIERVEKLGFMALSNIHPGFPSLTDETPREIWHTGDSGTDPWQWKDRAAAEKRLAFGCILGGHKGFVSREYYPLFHKLYRPSEHMEERREAGEVGEATWKLWQLFEERITLNTAEIRKELGVSKNKGASKADKAVTELQQLFYITVAGNIRKTNMLGEPYGWPANVYQKTENWVTGDWLKQISEITLEETRDKIIKNGIRISKGIDSSQLAKLLKIKS